MRKTLTAILDRLAQTNTRASLRHTRMRYSDETHLVYLRFDLRELLQDIDDSISARIPAHRSPAPPPNSAESGQSAREPRRECSAPLDLSKLHVSSTPKHVRRIMPVNALQ